MNARTTDVVIVGAGPYGLSLAAHLAAAGVERRIFGRPMQTWREHMPEGMSLKSEGFASNLADPEDASTLKQYCETRSIAYQDVGLPVPLTVFQAYGLSFQHDRVPDLDQRQVTRIERGDPGFVVTLEDGESVQARRVVLAVGITHFAYLPEVLAGLPADLVSHCAQTAPLAGIAGRRVAVLGAGASALDTMKLLLEAGAAAELVARAKTIRFHAPPSPGPRPWRERLRAPMSGLGPGWKSRLCTDAPLLFHAMPEAFRHKVVARHLGPAPCWWTNDAAVRAAPMHLGETLEHAEPAAGALRLHLRHASGSRRAMTVDHLIAGTGYRIDMARLSFLAPALRAALRTERGAPVLDRTFGSSVPGLHFVGLASAPSFGPMTRFVFGARYTARRLSAHLRATAPARATAESRQPQLLTGALRARVDA